MSRRRILGPFNRVEGDLEVRIEADDERILAARVNSPLFRGFEQILVGKPPSDALVYTPRICGICSVSQSVAAARALGAAAGVQPTPNGGLAANLILAAENLADHLTHFYLFFMPDLARDGYSRQAWFAKVAARFKAQTGNAAPEVLRARAEFLHLTALLAGKWPHSLALQPGGTTCPLEPAGKMELLTLLGSFRRFLESTLFADDLEAVAALDSVEALNRWRAEQERGDFGRFLALAEALDFDRLGRGPDHFLSYGAYELDGEFLFRPGVWLSGAVAALDTDAIREDLSHSWLAGQSRPEHPFDGSTIPSTDESEGYSWCKAPRLDGRPMEVGALARQQVDGHPLIRDLVAHSGGNVRNRVIARLLELARVVPRMQAWARALRPGEPFCRTARLPSEGQGAGLTEAARGSLGHWLRIRDGRIANYQIIAPTTWNFSPRDAEGVPGPLEQALAGTPLAEPALTEARIQHVIRSFDPCMVCTVH
ncbi:MAG TPA: HupV protein [Gammaproteobacteria bacterium]|nr:HupV protein [Gammaproteobacteria bacterium]